MYGYEWTEENGIFRLTINAKIQKEIRPVFHEELDFFGMDQYWDYPKDTTAPLLWAEGVRRYVLNGVCVAEAQGGGFYTKPTIKRLTEERLKLVPIDTDRLYEVNRQIMLSLEQKAVQFIQTQYEHYLPLGFSFVCAFSGGKDSLVLLDLMTKALAPKDYYVVFSNTGMELSDTLKTFVDAQKHWPGVRFKEAKCHMDMEESWNEFGPPASKLRWCCSVRKSVPTLMLLSELTGKDTKAVVFDGVRAEESLRRSKYTEVGEGVKNIQQVNCHAILKWSSAEIFVYALKKNVLLNNAYRHGIYRVGCKVCPMSAKWQDSLISFNYPDEVKSQLRMLEDMTLFAKGKIDKKYIEDGGWQARAGGKILKQGENRVSEEITATSIVFRIKNARQNWNSVLPIWGIPVDDDGKRITVKTKHGNFEMNYREENGQQIVSISPFFQLDRFDISTLRSIANKTAYCVGCKACTPQCPTGAYQIIDGKIVIRANRCVHCYNCCTYTDKGCMVAKSLFVRGENMENPDKYRNFGFRQSFYSHFVDTGVDCFDLPDQDKVLGKDQYKALKQWVAESGILKIETKGSKKVVLPELTVLGNKLINIGVYNPFGWAVMWANLAYNSIVVNAFCLNIGVGETFNKDDIVGILKYLQHTELFKDSDSERYFDSYKSYKLSNRLPQDEDIYFSNFDINSYPYRYTLLSDSITTDSVILWIDALGAEWLSLLCWTLQKDNNGQIKSVALAQSCLPTETEYNDQWNKMDTPHDKLDKLDKLAHHGVIDDPSYYACIQEQFSFFSKVVDKVEELFQKYHRVIITGDHGSSRLAARFFHAREGYPAPASSQVCSHGRFCIFNGAKIIASSNQVIAKDSDGNQYLIFKNYDHFKQSGFAAGGDDENAQYGELHGGASPEELLVPVVVFDSIHELPLTATWKKDSIKFSMKKAKPVILFNKPVQNVQASLGSVDGICTPIDTVGKEWMIVFSENKAEATKNFKYDPIIIADGKVVHVPSLEIKPALGGGDFDL